MRPIEERLSGWRGISLIAITYIYFLIFAQFAFLARLSDLGIADAHLKLVMGAMACGGILVSLATPRILVLPRSRSRLRLAFLACGGAALLSLAPLGLIASVSVSCLTGCALALLTVTLVTHLRAWLGSGDLLIKVAIGTGLGYFFCNFPPFFSASSRTQTIVSAALCTCAFFISSIPGRDPFNTPPADEELNQRLPSPSFARVLVCLTALVWFDSAAFYIIQHTPALKAGTWEGTLHLWVNGFLHFAAALWSVYILRRRGLSALLSLSFLALASSCLLLLDPARAFMASVLYPVGVSLYSVALVAYPSLLASARSTDERGRLAGSIYALAGWIGSAMGIGMGQHLGHVPVAFIVAAGIPLLAPELLKLVHTRRREFATTACVMLSALCVEKLITRAHGGYDSTLPQVQRGRQVYFSEGCIHCHSQYVRPNTPDVLIWGPVTTVAELRQEQPPLIGNRRQGPDLSEVGGRRSPLWLKAHLYAPSQLSPSSFMPSYEYLFRSHRGNDLVAYLASLRQSDLRNHLAAELSWRLSGNLLERADADRGDRLFQQYCSTCHSPLGATRMQWSASFKRLPPDLSAGPLRWVPSTMSLAEAEERLAQIIKFGIPGTDMAGHEYLPESQVASISVWLAPRVLHATKEFTPAQDSLQTKSISTGDKNEKLFSLDSFASPLRIFGRIRPKPEVHCRSRIKRCGDDTGCLRPCNTWNFPRGEWIDQH